jgi:hypothetical protein
MTSVPNGKLVGMILANIAFFVAISAFNLYQVKIIGNYRPQDSSNLVFDR